MDIFNMLSIDEILFNKKLEVFPDLEAGLQIWCNEVRFNPEHSSRVAAMERIQECYLSDLDSLDLTDLKLTSLPPQIGILSELQILEVANNQLLDLPPEIGTLSNLELFDASHNQLSELPAYIGDLSNLQFLILDANKIKKIPHEI